jgi:hypothetical protein
MSVIRVDSITNKTQDARPILSIGASIAPGYALTSTQLNVGGDIIANSFVGDGSGLTNLPVLTVPQVAAIKRLGIWFDDYRF